MESTTGVSANGSPRTLEMERVGAMVELWAHGPGHDNGWLIRVDPAQLLAALQRLRVAAAAPDGRTAGAAEPAVVAGSRAAMTCEEVLRILAQHKEELAAKQVKSIAVFGSMARGEARPDSDVDILVEIDHEQGSFGLFAFTGLKLYLEDLLGRTVDLATPNALRPEFRETILKEAIRAA